MNDAHVKVTAQHLGRDAYLYVRQSSWTSPAYVDTGALGEPVLIKMKSLS